MPDTYTTTASLDLDQTAYDLLLYYALRPQLYFDQVADVKPTRQSFPGAAVVFTIMSDLNVASTALDESTDVSAVAMADTQVTVTLAEYGNAVVTTYKARATAFVPLDPAVANVVGFNAGISQDTLARDVLKAGSNVLYANGGSARNRVIPTDTLKAADVRKVLAQLKGANVMDFGGYYAAFIHPDQSYDLRGETGAAAWRDPHTYSQTAEIWNGEIGAFEGFRFVETPRAPVFADAGSSTTLTDVYAAIFTGRQSLAKAYTSAEGRGPSPRIIFGPVTDKLERFRPVGWHWMGGYGRFREAAIRRLETASTIGTNS